MVTVKIELQGKGDGWQIKKTTIDYGGQEVQRLGPIDQVMEYEEAVKESKRWTMLTIRGKTARRLRMPSCGNLNPRCRPDTF